mgnify:CR=1 FL=1
MKHLLNNLSEEEKNAKIRELYNAGNKRISAYINAHLYLSGSGFF